MEREIAVVTAVCGDELLAQLEVVCLIAVDLQTNRNRRVWGLSQRPVALLLAVMVLLISCFRFSPALHSWLGCCDEGASGVCIIALFSKGQMIASSASVGLMLLALLLVAEVPVLRSVALPEFEFRFLPGRAPPFAPV